MSSTIPIAPPAAVRLTARGQSFWAYYVSTGQVTPCKPDDVYLVQDVIQRNQEHYHVIQAHSYSTLWVGASDCIPVAFNNSTGQWEEVK